MGVSKIEWLSRDGRRGRTWTPIVGCRPASKGCENCYAALQAARLGVMKKTRAKYEGLATREGGRGVWTGRVAFDEHALMEPLRTRAPTTFFVTSMGDLFHSAIPDNWLDSVFATAALCPRHTFLLLTKRSERAREYVLSRGAMIDAPNFGFLDSPLAKMACNVSRHAGHPLWMNASLMFWSNRDENGRVPDGCVATPGWPLPNLWFGVSVEDQATADERREDLRALAEMGWSTFVSYEPALGPVDWRGWEFVDWIISGGETGVEARPSHPDWHRDARDFCAERGKPYFLKGWGKWAPGECLDGPVRRTETAATLVNGECRRRRVTPKQAEETRRDDEPDVCHVGKTAARDLLDGVRHHALPWSRAR